MPNKQRVKLLHDSLEAVQGSSVILSPAEICLIESGDSGFDSLVIGDGKTEARSLTIIPLNVSKGSTFLGRAIPDTIPGTPAQPVFYMATSPGVYSGFGDLLVEPGEISFLIYKYGGWIKETVLRVDQELDENSLRPVSNKVITEDLKELEKKITSGGNIQVDSELSDKSENPIMNKVVSEKFKELDWYDGN